MSTELTSNLDAALKALNGFTIDDLTDEQKKRLFQKAAESKAITGILQAAKVASIDIDIEIKDFLATRKSPHTRTAYRHAFSSVSARGGVL